MASRERDGEPEENGTGSVKEYLDEHYAEKIMLEELAEKFFINKFYLSKIFKETYGTTVNNYLISKRITRAKQLLRFTDSKRQVFLRIFKSLDFPYNCS